MYQKQQINFTRKVVICYPDYVREVINFLKKVIKKKLLLIIIIYSGLGKLGMT